MDLRGWFLLPLLVTLFFESDPGDCCRAVDARRAIVYRLIKADARSPGAVLVRRRVAGIAKCRDFAEHKERRTNASSSRTEEEANCVLLRCPETSALRQLVNVSGVDYYSAYAANVTGGNQSLSCVDNVGLFVLFTERLNYTNAREACRKIGASLADVSNEPRNRGVAALIGKLGVYVGLSNEGGGERVWKNEFGEPLFCSSYRAWDLGEPSHGRGCVQLFQGDRKTEPTWRVVSCGIESPYVCEMPRTRDPAVDLRDFFLGLALRQHGTHHHHHRKG